MPSRILSFLLLLLCTTTFAQTAAPTPPNILFVLIDDMGWSDLGCFGSKRAQTPAIDRLAKEGIRFTQFYVNAPICSPSRVAFTTGQYPNRWKITSYLATRKEDAQRGIADWLDPSAPTLPRMLAQGGYYTAHVGKWHMGGQRDVGDAPVISAYGFQSTLTSFEGLGERVLPKFEPKPDGSQFVHEPTSMNAKLGGGPIHWVDRHKVTEVFVDRALAEVDRAAEAKKPFYVNLWLDDVHSPMQAPPDLRGSGSPADNYLSVINAMDKQLARIFDRIRDNPQLKENTIILLCSDNGPERGLGLSHPLRGDKGQLYEGGIRSPLIVWSPKLVAADRAGKTNETTVLAAMDFAPSLLVLTEIKAPEQAHFDGLEMSAALTGKSDAERNGAVMWVRPPDRPGPRGSWPDLAIREGKWKLLIHRDRSRPELFDVVSDPPESKNLAEQNSDLVKKMGDRVIAWDREISSDKKSMGETPIPR
jgi:uncharacterized sulfatase